MTGSNHTSLVLQERDLKLLEALELMRVVDREQAKVVAGFRSTTRANTRLLALTRAGFLKRAFLGSRHAVYWLASKNGRQSKESPEAPTSREPAALFLRHRLEINRALLTLKYASIPMAGWWFVQWQSFQQSLSATLPLIPDGYFEMGSGQGVLPLFLEIDLGTEAVTVIERKARLYLQLATSGEFTALFHQPRFRVLVVTTSQRRLINLRTSIAKITDKIFWFTTIDSLSPERFWSSVWLRPTGDERHSLI